MAPASCAALDDADGFWRLQREQSRVKRTGRVGESARPSLGGTSQSGEMNLPR